MAISSISLCSAGAASCSDGRLSLKLALYVLARLHGQLMLPHSIHPPEGPPPVSILSTYS